MVFPWPRGVLGDVDAAVVDITLRYFAPTVVAEHWDSGRAVVPPAAVAWAHLECCRDFGRRHLSGAPFLASFVPAAAKVLAEASPVALPLFAGVNTFPLAEDLPGAATQAVAMLRKFGAGVHLLALAAVSLEPRKAHWLTTPGAWESFGYRPSAFPHVTKLDRKRLTQADGLTRNLLKPTYSELMEREGEDLLGGLASIKSLLPVPEFPVVKTDSRFAPCSRLKSAWTLGSRQRRLARQPSRRVGCGHA